jgi:transposase-like protein
MERLPRKIHTYEYKLEAVRVVESGQSVAEAARSIGVAEQTLELDSGLQDGQAQDQRSRVEADRRADRDPTATSGSCAFEDEARHPGKSYGVLREVSPPARSPHLG